MKKENRKEKAKLLLNIFYTLRHKIMLQNGKILKTYHITLSQWLVMGTIREHKCETVKDIAKLLGITSSAATQLVRGLEKEGYIHKSPGEKDKRYTRLELSQKTTRILQEIEGRGAKNFLRIFEVLSEKEFNTYISLNKKIVEYIQAPTQKTNSSLCHF